MMTCISEPVSYLRLERYGLHELPAEEDRRIAEHLAQCPTCRACYERIQADVREPDLAALAAKLSRVPPPIAARPRLNRPLWGAGALIASLACLLFMSRMQPDLHERAGTTALTKGDGIAIELVRADAQGQLLEPTRFAAGDRFKLLLTCPPQLAGTVRVLAFQGGSLFEPVPAQPLSSCGNRRALSGAWQFGGQAAVDLCAVFIGDASGSREEKEMEKENVRSPDALPWPHVCAHLEPVAVAP